MVRLRTTGRSPHVSDQPSTGLPTDHPGITYDNLQIDHADSQRDQPGLTHMEQENDLVMQISGTGHWFLEGWIGDHSVEFMVDSDVELFVSNTDPGRCSAVNTGTDRENTTQRKRHPHWGVGMFQLCCFFLVTAGGVSGSCVRLGSRYQCHYWNRRPGLLATSHLGH